MKYFNLKIFISVILSKSFSISELKFLQKMSPRNFNNSVVTDYQCINGVLIKVPRTTMDDSSQTITYQVPLCSVIESSLKMAINHPLESASVAIGIFMTLISSLAMTNSINFIANFGIHRISAGGFVAAVLMIFGAIEVKFGLNENFGKFLIF